jgi:formate dehydrogenase (NADP+) alpha subunit
VETTIRLTINGEPVEARKGMTVLEAARSAGIFIPTLCADPDLEPYGACRLCVVEIDGLRGLPTSCTTPATNGMIVRTETSAVNGVRKTVMELLIADHPAECLTCVKNQNCELQKMAAYLGITEEHFPKTTRTFDIDTSNPFFNLDRNKCILCARCIRVCNEITGVGAIDLINRGYQTRVATFGDKPLIESICRSCGECMAHCPVGALSPKETVRVEYETKTTCPYCGVGCQMKLGVKENKIVTVHGDRDNQINRGRLCAKGRFGIVDFVNSQERLTVPLIRKDGKFIEATWNRALELVAARLGEYKDKAAVISSAKCTNEDNYVIQKFARVVLGTNNVDHCARLCHAPTVAGLAQSFGSGAMTNSIDEISHASCILAIGTNTTETHPIIGWEVRKATRKGGKLIVANPLEIALCREATLWLQYQPGTDVALIMGICRVIVDEGLADSAFIERRCENYVAFKESLKDFSLEFVKNTTGVAENRIIEAARLIATDKPSTILYAMGITQHTHGTDNVIALANLSMLTGNVGKPSAGVNPLRGQNNVQGACDVGGLPNVYPGYLPVTDPFNRQKFESAWEVPLSAWPGLTLTELIDESHTGTIKAIYLVGENPALSDPDVNHVLECLKQLDFLVVQDIFLTETAKLAHVVLPGASFAEKDGTFTNTERRVQRIRKVIEPAGDSKPDWWITCQIAKKMGAKGFEFENPSQIMDEINRLMPSYGGITYERLEKGGLQWPCPDLQHPGTPILHTGKFSRGMGQFIPLKYKPSVEQADQAYPLILTTGRSIFQYHTGTMTRKVKGLNVMRNEELVEINPIDAENLGITGGETVKIISRRGEITAKAKITEGSPAGVVFMTFHFFESPTNVLTSKALDPVAKIPEYKVTAVRVEKIKHEAKG